MAGQDVVVTYRADVDDLTQKLKIVIDRMDKLEAESKQAAKGLDTTTKSADKLGKELADVGKTTQKATNDVKGFAKSANTELSGLSSSVSSIGLGLAASLGAAFTVDAVIAFGKASVNAFLEAQENAEKLRFTITQVGGESEAAFQRLIDQSAKLQDITIFSDDSIQQAQNALATFGLTSDQITALLPKLADFASATKTDIVQAAQQVGAGLQGAGREFKKYGIEVSATASELDNLNAITDGFVKFQGAAAKETETLTGQLQQQANAADELQEALGEKLAPIFVRLKTALFEASLGLLGFNKAVEDLAQSNIDAVESNILKSAEKIKASGGDVVETYSKRVEEIKAINIKAAADIEAINQQLTDRLVQLSKSKLEVAPENDAQIISLNKQVEAINKVIAANDLKVKSFQTVIDAEQKAAVDSARTLTAEQLRVKSIADLNSLLQANGALNDLLSKKNVSLINEELAARKKLSDQAVKDRADKLKALQERFDKFNAENRQADADATKAEIDEYNKRDAAFFKSLENKKTAAEDFYKDAQKILTDAFLQETSQLPEPEKQAVAESFEAEIRADEAAKIKAIDADLNADFEDKQNQKVIVSAEATKQIEELFKALGLEIKKISGTASEGWTEDMQNIASASVDLFNSLSQLYSTFANKRLEEINKTTAAELDALDLLSKKNEEDLDKKRISEREFANNQKRIEEEKIKVQAAADKKSRDIKRKAALLDKAAALFQIAISTAQNIASTKLLPLIVLYAAAGAAQAAIVAAQPIPYAKGTKSAKQGLARVGEQGEEIMYVPGGTKVLPNSKTVTYGSVLDKMFDGTFDKYYMKREIAPRMVAQRKAHEATKEKSFARNISESIVLNSSLDTNPIARQLGKGQRITNVDEIADAIARRTEISPYRR